MHRLINVVGDATPPKNIVCPNCGEHRGFQLLWLGDLSQGFSQTDAGERNDYDSHDNEGDFLNLEIQIACGHCDTIIMERPVTITVPPWQYWNPQDDSLQPEPVLQCWRVFGQYPDSFENHYDDYVLMPQDWNEERVQEAMIVRAENEEDLALVELLVETATFERVPHEIIKGQLYVPAETTNAVYR